MLFMAKKTMDQRAGGGKGRKPAAPETPAPPLAELAFSAGALSRGSKVSERIASALVNDIIERGLGPGDRLPNEAVMSEYFGVGRGSVREALRLLEVHGLISLVTGPKGGPVIVAVDPRYVARTLSLYLSLRGATIEELAHTRLFIEPHVARLAAENLSPDRSARLEAALAAEEAVAGGDHNYIEAANEFHYVISTMSGNRVLDLVATALKELYTGPIVGGGVARVTTDPSIRLEHREIGEAILAGDADRAEDLMREHMNYYLGKIRDTAPSFPATRITWS